MAPQATRDQILETARRLFHEQGYHATGVATILREAGVHSGSLYHHFRSKEDLLLAVLERYKEMLRPVVLAPAEAASEDPIGRVFALLDWYREGMAQAGCAMGCPIGNLALELADDLPPAREWIHLNFQNWTAGVRKWLEAAGDRLPRGTNLDALSLFVLTVMEGGIMQARAQGDLEPYDASVAQLRAYFDALEASALSEAAAHESKREPTAPGGETT